MNKMIIKSAFLTGFFLLVFVSCNRAPANLKSEKVSDPVKLNSSKVTNVVSDNSTDTVKTMSAQSQNKLIGRWLRSDGNYLLEISSVTSEGIVNARYFNPNPINVEKAEWIIKENRLFIRVILRDVNYPGSTYTLEYLPGNDCLAGDYFLAGEQINYNVVFTRKK